MMILRPEINTNITISYIMINGFYNRNQTLDFWVTAIIRERGKFRRLNPSGKKRELSGWRQNHYAQQEKYDDCSFTRGPFQLRNI